MRKPDENKIPVGISSCLLGEEVRYNGGHKHQRYCTDILSRYFAFNAFCPEVAIGMGVPREPIRLVGSVSSPKAVGTKSRHMDVTQALLEYAEVMLPQMEPLCGFIWMKDSPSCGLFNTKVYGEDGKPPLRRAGLVAGLLRQRLPLLPMEEGGRLNDPGLRENFIARVFLFSQWRQLMAQGITPAALVAFHSRQKYWVMSYGQKLYRELGRMVANAGSQPIADLAESYIQSLMDGTQSPPSRKGHVNVLYHMVGYLRETVPGSIRQDLTQSIEEYRVGQVPLAVPMKLMTHYIEHYASEYLKEQSYLDPHPFDLGLRNAL